MNNILPIVKKGAFILLGLIVFYSIFIHNWSFVFKKRVVGEVVAAERVAGTMTIVTNSQDPINPQTFSFSVAIKDRKSGEIHMASSEDRKWAAVSKGNCVVAAFFPYAPWNMLSKGMTDHNARLLRNFQSCADLPEHNWFDSVKFFFLIE